MSYALKLAIERAGGAAALGRELGISTQAVSQWGGQVPSNRVIEVERVTGVNRRLLRPDLYPPEQAVA